MDIFHIFVVEKIDMFVWKDENKQQEAGDGPLKNKVVDSAEIKYYVILLIVHRLFMTLGPG